MSQEYRASPSSKGSSVDSNGYYVEKHHHYVCSTIRDEDSKKLSEIHTPKLSFYVLEYKLEFQFCLCFNGLLRNHLTTEKKLFLKMQWSLIKY